MAAAVMVTNVADVQVVYYKWWVKETRSCEESCYKTLFLC